MSSIQVPRLINDYIVYDSLSSGILSSNGEIYSAYNSSGVLYIIDNELQSQSNNGLLYIKECIFVL